MKDFFYLLLVTAFCASLSCNPVFYSPDPHNNPLISEKGETNLGGNVGVSGDSYNWGIHGSYGLTPTIAFKFNGNFYKSSIGSDDNFSGSGKLLEVAPGYYSKITDKLVFNAYGIAAYGTVKNNNLNSSETLNASMLRYGLQPEIGYKSQTVHFLFSTRVVHLHHYNLAPSTLQLNSDNTLDIRNNFLIEPSFTLRLGPPNLKFQAQMGLSINVLNQSFRQEHLYLGTGLNINLNALAFRNNSSSKLLNE